MSPRCSIARWRKPRRRGDQLRVAGHRVRSVPGSGAERQRLPAPRRRRPRRRAARRAQPDHAAREARPRRKPPRARPRPARRCARPRRASAATTSCSPAFRARYGKDITNDLVFRPRRRRRWPRVPHRWQEARGRRATSSINNFQGRYIIRHRWTGPVACRSAPRHLGRPAERGTAATAVRAEPGVRRARGAAREVDQARRSRDRAQEGRARAGQAGAVEEALISETAGRSARRGRRSARPCPRASRAVAGR